jgi:hypothetical protein
MNLGRLEKITDLREVWKTEDKDFTPWLANEENLALLGETIHMDLELEAVEKYVGPFRADILCRNTDDNSHVLVENQVERTDHTHLGQLMTYAAGLDTVSIVWIAREFTDEHRAALDWLNEITGDKFNFFGLEIELWRIGESAIAPKFNVISKPNDWTKGKAANVGGVTRENLTSTEELKLEYWQSFKDYVLDQKTDIRTSKPSIKHWMDFRLGTSRAHTVAAFNTRNGDLGVCLWIGNSKDRLAVFNLLENERDAIEKEIGCELEWEERPEWKSSRISLGNPDLDPKDRDSWQEQHKWMLDNLEKFNEVFGSRVRDMDVGEWQPAEIDINEE